MSGLYNTNPNATNYANIGAAYNQMDDFEKAMEYAMKALALEVNSQTVSNSLPLTIIWEIMKNRRKFTRNI